MILSVLQIAEAGRTSDPQAGSYGALLEALITKVLGSVSTGFPDFITKNAFISRIAFHLFETRRQSVTRAEVDGLIEQYFAEYNIKLNARSILRDLEDARIFYESGGNYRFRYMYYYYYFVARYLADNLKDRKNQARMRVVLNDMVDKVHSLEFSSILMFVVYRTQDRELVERILTNARMIYSTCTPCDFERDVEFINKLYKEAPRLLLPPADVRQNIEENRRTLETADEIAPDQATGVGGEAVQYRDELNDVLKINIALKTLEIMGQVLRNFGGGVAKRGSNRNRKIRIPARAAHVERSFTYE